MRERVWSRSGFGNFSAFDSLRKIALDCLPAARERIVIHVAQNDFKAGRGSHLRDAVAHRAGAKHTDSANRGASQSTFFRPSLCSSDSITSRTNGGSLFRSGACLVRLTCTAISYTIRATENAN